MGEIREVNRSLPRTGIREKLNGKAVYGADIRLPRMLYAKGVVSGAVSAKINGIDTSDALTVPGVLAVYTAKDVPGENGFGDFSKDEPVIAGSCVKHAGDVIAVVIAETLHAAEEGAMGVRADLTEMPAVLTVEEALKADVVINPEYPDNICAYRRVVRGDAEPALLASDIVVDETYETSWVEHAYIEPEAIVVVPQKDGCVEMRGCTQNVFFNRDVIKRALNLPEEKILINPDNVGGSFGGKCEQISAMAARAAMAALDFGRPVSYVLTREESVNQSSKRHGIRTHIRLGASFDGKLTALCARAVMDAGAYVNESPIVTWKSINCGAGPYEYTDVFYDNTTVMTNNMVCGAMRGFGTPQAIYALESAMNELAQQLHMNPLDLRRKNFLREGARTANNHLLSGHAVSIASVAEKAAAAIDFDRKYEEYSGLIKNSPNAAIRRGVGIACSIRGVSFGADSPDVGRAKLTILPDGRIEVRCPIMEIGQGADTVLRQICADALSIPADQVTRFNPETLHSPDSGPAGASRGTFIGGNSILLAAQALRIKIANALRVSPEELQFKDGKAGSRTWKEIYQLLTEKGIGASATETYTVPTGEWDEDTCQGEAFISYVYSCHAAEVEVDTDTGMVRVLQMAACHDAGRIINPEAAKGQVTGGMAMGIGMALTEAVETDRRGVIKTDNFDSFIIPTSADACEMKVIFEENPDRCGPFGGKSLGEPAMEPAPAAVAGAVNMALGDAGAIRKIPATLEDVFFAAHPELADRNTTSTITL